jgi:hypothetical protein
VHVRVVRFTDVDPQRVESMLGEIEQSEGPPEGVKAHSLQMVLDADQKTAVVIQFFDSADDMSASEQALDSMDPSDTPGTRASVDRGELKLDLKM